MNFINLAQKTSRKLGSSLVNLVLFTGSFTTVNASSYYSSRKGRGYSRKSQSYLVDSGLSAISKNLLSAKSSMHIAQKNTPKISRDFSVSKGAVVGELVIVDRNVKGYHIFSQLVKPGVEVIEIPKEADGLDFLLSKLAEYQDLSAVHLFSHGASGKLLLGRERVDNQALQSNLQTFNVLNRAIAPGGDLLLYGCELAKSEEGENLLEIIKGNTHVDVAASSDRTGNLGSGGDWDLEIQKGDIEATPLADSVAMKDFTGVLQSTFSMNVADAVTLGDYGGAGNNAQFNENGGTNYILTVDGVSDGTYASGTYTYVGGGGGTYESGIVLSLSGGEIFDPTSLSMYSSIPTTLTFTSDVSGSIGQYFDGSTPHIINLSALAATTSSITISSTANFSGRLDEVILDIDGILSVNPIFLEARSNNNSSINLYWNHKINDVKAFQLQRSVDGKEWITIFESDNRTLLNHFTDYEPNKENYYRLNILTDNKSYMSKIIKASIEEKELITLYPNPSTGLINVLFENETIKSIEITDLLGKLVQQNIFDDAKKKVAFRINEKGIFILKIVVSNRIVYRKISIE